MVAYGSLYGFVIAANFSIHGDSTLLDSSFSICSSLAEASLVSEPRDGQFVVEIKIEFWGLREMSLKLFQAQAPQVKVFLIFKERLHLSEGLIKSVFSMDHPN